MFRQMLSVSLRAPSRLKSASVSLLAVAAAVASVCFPSPSAIAQMPLSSDPKVRSEEQWEEVLLQEDFDYLQLTAQQRKDLQPLADYARGRMDEVERLRKRLQASLEEQHQALLKGKRPTNSEQGDILDRQRKVQESQATVSSEIVDRLTPKLGGILTKRQTVRAWLLMQNKVPAPEPKRIALTDPGSGFVLPQMDGRDAIEEIVKAKLRRDYAPEVIDQALIPWEFASFAAFGGPGSTGGPGGAAGPNATAALQAFQGMDPGMGQRMFMLGQRMLKQFAPNGDPAAPRPPPVAPEVRTAINKDAADIRKRIESDPETYLTQAGSAQLLEALRPLTRRLFLSPRVKEALATGLPK